MGGFGNGATKFSALCSNVYSVIQTLRRGLGEVVEEELSLKLERQDRGLLHVTHAEAGWYTDVLRCISHTSLLQTPFFIT